MPDTNAAGAIAEGAVLAALLAAGKTVLMPFGTQPYDLVFEDAGVFHRVQVKAGREYRGALNFNAFSRTGDDRRHKITYRGKIDYFGIYLPTRRTCYLIPIKDVGQVSGMQGNFRLDPPKNNQSRGIRYAHHYLIKAL
jgi:hypothetical protein